MTADFGYSTQTTVDQMMYFDPYRMASFETGPEALIGHIFMSRPSLYLSEENLKFLRSTTRTAYFFNDPVARAALWSISTGSPSRWIPLIYKKAKTYSVNDMEIKATEKGGTYFGHTIRYGIHSEESKYGGSFTIDFRNDKDHSILWLMYLWMTYIHLISSERNFTPNRQSIVNGVLDYACSLYYIVTDRSCSKIVYFEKLLGVFPTKSPMSIFSWNDDMITQDTISIDFNYAFRADPMDFDILADFDYVSGLLSKDGEASIGASILMDLGAGAGASNEFIRKDQMARIPLIYKVYNSTKNQYTFHLGWSNSAGTGNTFVETGHAEYTNCTLPTSELEIDQLQG